MNKPSKPTVAALFAGAGGLDLGFKLANFEVPWANEYDKSIWATYEANFPEAKLDRRSIVEVQPEDIKTIDDQPFEPTGFIGGPPCQSWSEAGAARGIDDHRGQLFFEYLRLIEAKRPLFFLAENVSGILFSRHNPALDSILKGFCELGYNVSYGLLHARDYNVPEDRDRVIIVGYRTELGKFFTPPPSQENRLTLKDAIWDLRDSAVPATGNNDSNPQTAIPNHEYMVGGFSSMYMSRNRVRNWDEGSCTIQAGGRHAPIHPDAPKMVKIGKDAFSFDQNGKESGLYRRLSVRECARIQTFPDKHKFVYKKVADGYKMIGNAVPVEFARKLAEQIMLDIQVPNLNLKSTPSPGTSKRFDEIS